MSGVRLIFESDHRGHYLRYVAHIVAYLQANGERGVFAAPSSVYASAEFNVLLAHLLDDSDRRVVVMEPTYDELVGLALHEQASELVIPDARRYVYKPRFLARPGWQVRTRMLMMADPEDEPATLKCLAQRRVVSWVARRKRVEFKRLTSAVAEPARADLVPDPVDVEARHASERVQAVSSWVGSRAMYLLPGVISYWKNPEMVVAAFLDADLEDACLVFCGPVQEHLRGPLRSLAQRHPDTFLLDEGLVAEGEYNELVARAHAVVQAYSTHAPNSSSAKAVALGTSVVAAGSSRYLANLASIGGQTFTSVLEPAGLAAALRASRWAPDPEPRVLASVDDFTRALFSDAPRTRGLRHRLGEG